MLHSTGSLKFRKWEIDGANGEYKLKVWGIFTDIEQVQNEKKSFTFRLTGCEFSGVQTLLVVAIVYVKRGDENSAVRKMHDTSRLWVGWNTHDHCLFCSYAPEVCRSRRDQFSLYASRG